MSKKRTNAADKTKTVTVEKAAQPGRTDAVTAPKMYVGPTITDFAIQNRVYTDIPEAAKAKLKDQPELGNLFIEVSDYPKANKMLRERTGYIFSAYMKALALRK